MSESILKIQNLKKYFPTDQQGKYVKAIDDVSFEIRKNEVVGLVGESGSGKSTTAYSVMGMHSISEGKIFFEGKDISMPASKRDLELKKKIQIVFQDPGSSLNPRRTIGDIIKMPLKVHHIVPKNEMDDEVERLLDLVGLPPDMSYRYSFGLGGGERQLVAIARALATRPSLIVLDEPTSSLDVSIQAKIINKLMELQKKLNMSYLFITHDMSLMRNIADRIAIMYLGRIMEMAPAKNFFEIPQHPYTKMLVSSIPVVLEEEEKIKPDKIRSVGEIPSPVNIPPGCRFHGRCPLAQDICKCEEPKMTQVFSDHIAACHLCHK